jgi:hypothetical protein
MSKGLSAEQRKAMLDEETGDGDGEVEIVEPPDPTPTPSRSDPPPQPAEVPPPPTPPPPDVNQLIQALVTGIQGGLSNAASMARTPIPEVEVDSGHSVYSHPDGDLKTPRTKLRCKMFLGIYDEHGIAKPAFEIFEDTCTEVERVELKKLVPGVYPGIERNDGVKALWRVVQSNDDNGQPTRLVIAVPQMWLSQEQFQQMPGQLNFLRQLNGTRVTTAVA